MVEILDPQWAVEQFERIDRELDELRRTIDHLRHERALPRQPIPGHDISELDGKPLTAYFLLVKAHERGDKPEAIVTASERNGEYDHRMMIHRMTANALIDRGLAEEVTWEQSQEDALRPHGLYLLIPDGD